MVAEEPLSLVRAEQVDKVVVVGILCELAVDGDPEGLVLGDLRAE